MLTVHKPLGIVVAGIRSDGRWLRNVLLLILGMAATEVVVAEAPFWNRGIPLFGKPSAEQAAQQGPSFEFPAPGAEPVTAVADASQTVPGKTASPPIEAEHEVQTVDFLTPGGLSVPEPMDLPAVPTSPEEIPQTPIAQAIANGETAEQPPLVETTESWYEIPWIWMTRGWKNHAEFGLDGSSGNARTLALQTGLEMTRKTDRYTLAVDFDYRKATNAGVTTEDNGRFDVNFDRLLKDSKWSAFGKFGAEWDQFKAFDSRLNLNSGVGYHFIRSDDASLATRFGAGASKEIGAPDDAWKPEAVFGIEAEYQLNRYNKMKGKVDYFPAWEDFSDYRVVTDVAWEILLDDTDNLSLKLALTDRYDSTPQGAKPNDVYYSLLLLVKF